MRIKRGKAPHNGLSKKGFRTASMVATATLAAVVLSSCTLGSSNADDASNVASITTVDASTTTDASASASAQDSAAAAPSSEEAAPPPAWKPSATMQVSITACVDGEKLPETITSNSTASKAIVTACKAKGEAILTSIREDLRGDVADPLSATGWNAELQALGNSMFERAGFIVPTMQSLKLSSDQAVKSDNPAMKAQVDTSFPGVTQEDIAIGSDEINWDIRTPTYGSHDFSGNQTLKSTAEVGAFLSGDSAQSVAAREYVTAAILAQGYGQDEVDRALSGAGYIPIQFLGASQILGTSYFADGKALVMGEWRQSAANDVYWLFIATDGRFVTGATVRSDCGNPNLTQIRMVRPDTPPAPPVEGGPEAGCPPGTEKSSSGECYVPVPKCPPGTDRAGQDIGGKDCNYPPPVEKCIPPKPYGTPPNCYGEKPNVDPQVQGNIPEQVGGDSPPAADVDEQPEVPAVVPDVYVTPEEQAPVPAPVVVEGSVIQAPIANEGPRVDIPAPEPGAPPATAAASDCSPPPGKTTC